MSKAGKREYIRVTTPRGVFVYPRLTEPDTKYVKPHGEYHTKFAVDTDATCVVKGEEVNFVEYLEGVLEAFIDEELPVIEERADGLKGTKLKKAQKKIEEAQKRETNDLYEEEYDDEGEETGRVIFRFKLAARVETEKKSWDQCPRLFDAKAQAIPDGTVNPWTGSEGKCNIEIFPYFMEKDAVFGLSLRLVGAQILKLVTGKGGASAEDMGFGAEEDGYTAGGDSGFDPEEGDEDEDDDEF